MKHLAYILIVFCLLSTTVDAGWPFRRRAIQQQQRQPSPSRAVTPNLDDPDKPITYTWHETPHWQDGYWVEYTGEQMAEITGIRGWKGYPFSHYVWEWPGYKLGDKTWCLDDFPGNPPPRKKRLELRPDYSPYWPGQKYNL